MSLTLKVGGFAFAAAIAATLGFAFWPHVKADKISAKNAVEQPVFVVASATRSLAPPPAVTATPLLPTSQTPDQAGLDKLAVALKIDAPVVPNSVSRSLASPAASGAAQHFAQGLVALADGDIAAARRWLERAADEGETRAYLALGDAYNPVMLTKLGVIGAPGDPARARENYNRALSLGLQGARERLASLAD